jgi:acyl-CoA reductase-like NAD-dependent aldehyde dehydrogenase
MKGSPMAKSNAEIAADVRAGGNMPGDMIFDPRKPADEQVRAKTADEKKADVDAAKAEAKRANGPGVAEPVNVDVG